MQYTQTLRMVNGLKWFAIVFACMYAFVVVVAASNGIIGHIPSHDKQFDIPLPALFALAALVAAFYGTRYARTLSEENEEHLPIVWTRPRSRVQSALTIIGVDALGILATFAMYLILTAAFITTFQVWPYVTVPGDAWVQSVRYILEPFAVYALFMALTASMGKTGRGLAFWYWLGMLAIGGFASASIIPDPWHAIFNYVNFINPLAYSSYHSQHGTETVNVMGGPSPTYVGGLSPAMDAAALAILFVSGISVAIARWRNLEA